MRPPLVASLRAPFTTREVFDDLTVGVTARQVDYWVRMGWVAPSVRAASGSGRPGRLWSRRDVVALRVVALLQADNHKGGNAGIGGWRLEALVRLVRSQPVEKLAGRYLVAVEGNRPVLLTFDEFADSWRNDPAPVKVIPLGPLVDDLIGMAP